MLKMNVLIADDHMIVRIGVKMLLQNSYPKMIVHEAERFGNVIDLLTDHNIELLILDINMPEGNNIDVIAKIKVLRPKVKIIMFSTYSEDVYGLRYLELGVDGYLNKGASNAEFKKAVDTVLANGKYISDQLKNKMLLRMTNQGSMAINPISELSNQELEVAKLIGKGLGTIEIADALHVKMSTVSTYKRRIFEKLQISNVIALTEMLRLYNVG